MKVILMLSCVPRGAVFGSVPFVIQLILSILNLHTEMLFTCQTEQPWIYSNSMSSFHLKQGSLFLTYEHRQLAFWRHAEPHCCSEVHVERGTISGNLFHLPFIVRCRSQVLHMSPEELFLASCQLGLNTTPGQIRRKVCNVVAGKSSLLFWDN